MYCLGFIGTAAGLKNVCKETSIGYVFENTKYNSVLFLEILEPPYKSFLRPIARGTIYWTSSWRRRNKKYLEISGVIDKDVFRLQVAVDDVERVKIFERQDDLGRVERCVGLAAGTQATPAY